MITVFLLQMVVVSDDVHEYAVALKDTDEKIARCPGRVRLLDLLNTMYMSLSTNSVLLI